MNDDIYLSIKLLSSWFVSCHSAGNLLKTSSTASFKLRKFLDPSLPFNEFLSGGDKIENSQTPSAKTVCLGFVVLSDCPSSRAQLSDLQVSLGCLIFTG